MADVLGGGAEPSAKRAKLSVAGFEADVSEFLRTETLHLAAASGVLLGADGPFAHAPCSLLPYPFPASLFAQAKSLATPFNLLVDRISRDLEWLCAQVRSVVAHDEFTRKLLEIAEVIKEEGAPQPLQLGIYRSDYMVHQPSDDATPRLLQVCRPPPPPRTAAPAPHAVRFRAGLPQVELNTISCSFVALAAKLSSLHRHLVPRCGAHGAAAAALRAQPPLAAALEDAERLPANGSCREIAAAIARAHGEYLRARGKPSGAAVVLMLVQPSERNVIDQRGVAAGGRCRRPRGTMPPHLPPWCLPGPRPLLRTP